MEKNYTFGRYLTEYAKESKVWLSSENGYLHYWINMAKNTGEVKFRILTSDNDFLNDEFSWDKLSNENIILEDGGHYGVNNYDWFEKFVAASYKTLPY